MRDKLVIFVSIYWILQSLLIFSVKSFDNFTQIVGCVFFLFSVLNLIIKNKNFKLVFLVVTILYSIIFLLLAILLITFFQQEIGFYIATFILSLTNIGASSYLWQYLKEEQNTDS